MIKIAIIFIEANFKDFETTFKSIRNYVQCISVFIDITKVADFQSKNADVSRTQGGVSRFLHIFL